MAQKIRILMFPRGMQKKFLEETGYKRTSVYFALTGKVDSEQARDIRELAISKYGAFTRPANY